MRVRNEVLAAKCSDRWIGLRSPVSWAKPTTSEAETVLLSRSVMPTERSSKNNVRSGGRLMVLLDRAGRQLTSRRGAARQPDLTRRALVDVARQAALRFLPAIRRARGFSGARRDR